MIHLSRILVAVATAVILFACEPTEAPVQFHLQHAADTAELVAPGLISTNLNERDFAISPQADELMYSLAVPDNSIRAIIVMRKLDGRWTDQRIAPFSGQDDDIEPFYAPDGQRLFFASNRLTTDTDSTNDFNLWYCERQGTTWGRAQLLPDIINSPGEEYYPSVAANGNLYFTASREDTKGTEDIYVSKFVNGAYTTPVSLDTTVNTRTYEFNAYISPDESFLLFGSYGREDGYGGGDIYISRRNADGSWGRSKNLGPAVNGSSLDYCPYVDQANNVFYFSSNRGVVRREDFIDLDEMVKIGNDAMNGSGNIYRISTGVIPELKNAN